MRKKFTVMIDTITPITDRDLIEHIEASVKAWGGSYDPSDQLFPDNIRQVRATKQRNKKT